MGGVAFLAASLYTIRVYRRPHDVHPRVRRIVLLSAGWFLVVLGFIGLFLPILQGVLFITAGLLLIAEESRATRYFLLWLKRRYPQIARKFGHLFPYRRLKKKRRKHSGGDQGS